MQIRRLPLLISALAMLVTGSAAAQSLTSSPASPAPSAQAAAAKANAATAATSARPERAIERLRTQDAGSRIDELRVGGETQSISVQPAGNAPAFEVRPANSAGQEGAGARFWNVLKF
jgi:hypothetical protein